jgi:hypothetical protein
MSERDELLAVDAALDAARAKLDEAGQTSRRASSAKPTIRIVADERGAA